MTPDAPFTVLISNEAGPFERGEFHHRHEAEAFKAFYRRCSELAGVPITITETIEFRRQPE